MSPSRPNDHSDAPPPGLSWGIRRSFLEYISGLPDGRAVLDGGAAVSSAFGVTFPPATVDFDHAAGAVDLVFDGGLTFTGHFGMLNIRFGQPRVRLLRDKGTLFVVAGGGGPDADRPIAAFNTNSANDGCHRVWHGRDVRLLSAGAELFGGVYDEGTPLDPLVAVIPQAYIAGAEQVRTPAG